MISTQLGPMTKSDPDSRPDQGRSAILLAGGPPSCSAMNRRWGLGTRGSQPPIEPHLNPNPIQRVALTATGSATTFAIALTTGSTSPGQAPQHLHRSHSPRRRPRHRLHGLLLCQAYGWTVTCPFFPSLLSLSSPVLVLGDFTPNASLHLLDLQLSDPNLLSIQW